MIYWVPAWIDVVLHAINTVGLFIVALWVLSVAAKEKIDERDQD